MLYQNDNKGRLQVTPTSRQRTWARQWWNHVAVNKHLFCTQIWIMSPNGSTFPFVGWRRNISLWARMVLTGMYLSWNLLWFSVKRMLTILLRFWMKFSQKWMMMRLVKVHDLLQCTGVRMSALHGIEQSGLRNITEF